MFVYTNLNPKKKSTNDCLTRALAYVLGISWDDALTLQYTTALSMKCSFDDNLVIAKILKNHGFEKINVQPKKGQKRQTPDSLSKTGNTYFATIAGHATAIANGNVYDTWDCSDNAVYTAYQK